LNCHHQLLLLLLLLLLLTGRTILSIQQLPLLNLLLAP
jgi:hypothetical protein